MGFWIFMLIMNMLLPAVMIYFGVRFVKKPPKDINMIYGFRTKRSMMNRDTWEFAHRYCGKIWRVIGVVLLTLSIVAMVLVMNKDIKSVGIYGSMICGVQIVVVIISLIPTNRALKNNFDEDGCRK